MGEWVEGRRGEGRNGDTASGIGKRGAVIYHVAHEAPRAAAPQSNQTTDAIGCTRILTTEHPEHTEDPGQRRRNQTKAREKE